MADYRTLERRRRRQLYWAVAAVSLLTVILAISLLRRTPPRRVVLATGQKDGAFDTFGLEYKKRLEYLGLHVELVPTNGSVDNLHRLLDHQVDLAFVQCGTYPLVDDRADSLRGLATIYYEPLWIFYRADAPIKHMNDLKGKTVAIGPRNSGTEALALALLKAHGRDEGQTKLVNRTLRESSEQLKAGEIDMMVAVSSYRDATILALLKDPGIGMWDFRRIAALSRKFPYLTPVKLAEGIIDLETNVPARDRTLLAPSAELVCREDMDPRVVEQVLKVAQIIHGPGSLIDPPMHFPSAQGLDVPIHEAAETYLKSGESMMSRLLPYWGVRMVYQCRVLLLPILLLWLPFLKVLPMIYHYRVATLLKKHYVALRAVEDTLAQAEDPQTLKTGLQALENLVDDMESLSRKVPGHLQRDVYTWRLHVSMVKAEAMDHLKRIAQNLQAKSEAAKAEAAKAEAAKAEAAKAEAAKSEVAHSEASANSVGSTTADHESCEVRSAAEKDSQEVAMQMESKSIENVR